MGAGSSVHDLLADDPCFEPVLPCGEARGSGLDVEAGGRCGVLALTIGLLPIHVAFVGVRSLFCACEHGSVCLIELPVSAPPHGTASFFEAARSGVRPTVKTPIGNLVSSLGAISGSSVDLLSMVRAFPSLRRLGEKSEITAWLWDYCRGTGAVARDASRCAYGGKAIYLCSLNRLPSLLSIAEDPHGFFVKKLLFTDSGNLLISAGADGYLRIWDGQTLRDISGKICKHGDSVSELAIDSSNTRLASGGAGSDTSVYVWDMRSLRSLSRLQAHTKDVTGLVFVTGVTGETAETNEVAGAAMRGGGGDGGEGGGGGDRWLVSGGMDGLLCVWDLLENRASETNTDTDRERDRDRDRDRATDEDIDRSQGVRSAGPLWQVSLEVRASHTCVSVCM
jgi:hypothetical protein